MPLPPEHISIKRRRQEEPVETLYLEHDHAHHQTKRRFTEYYFQRINKGYEYEFATVPVQQSPPLSLGSLSGSKNAISTERRRRRSASSVDADGVPIVRTVSAGERRQIARQLRQAARLERRNELRAKKAVVLPLAEVLPTAEARDEGACIAQYSYQHSPRRFHLARSAIPVLSPQDSGGGQKPVTSQKPHFATFVEKPNCSSRPQLGDPYPKTMANVSDVRSARDPMLLTQEGSQRTEVTTPRAPNPSSAARVRRQERRVIEMKPEVTKEDPDQLAEDLVAFALQLEPAGDSEREQMCPEERLKVKIVDEDVDMEVSYVYETYVRVPCGPVPRQHLALYQPPSTIGVLVIGQDDEEVWEGFVESGEESDWDEEDADSNAEDNPGNDYPEDEVSTDDEYGHDAYQYRYGASDDEEYALGNDPWSDDEVNDHRTQYT